MGSNDQEKIKIAREYFIRIDLGLRSSASPPAAERGRSRINPTTLNHKQKEIESWPAS
jgi:hypothetical protein